MSFRKLKAQIYWPSTDQKVRGSSPCGRTISLAWYFIKLEFGDIRTFFVIKKKIFQIIIGFLSMNVIPHAFSPTELIFS